MKIRLLQIIPILLSTAVFYTQTESSIQSLPTKQSQAMFNQDQSEVNPEYERVLKEYEKLIRKYPDKKELFFNLVNLNYLNVDSKSAGVSTCRCKIISFILGA